MATAYKLNVKPEDKDKAVKTKKTAQVNLEGNEVKQPKKVCPLVMGKCLGDSCAFFADKHGVCGIQIIVVQAMKIQ